jgi:hypothetical protein
MDPRAIWSDKRRQVHQDLTAQGYKLMHDDPQKSAYYHSQYGWHEVSNEGVGMASSILIER